MKKLPLIILFVISFNAFGEKPLTLKEAIQFSMEQSPYLKLQEKAVEAQKGELKKAWAFFPGIDAEAGRLRQSRDNYYTKLWKQKFTATGNVAISGINTQNEQDNLYWKVRGKYDIFRGFGQYNNLKEKKKAYEATVLEQKIVHNDLIYDVIETYVQILNLKNSLVYLTKAKGSAQSDVSNMKKRFEVELSPQTEVEQAEENLLRIDWRLLETEQALELTQQRLNQLMGRDLHLSIETTSLRPKQGLKIESFSYYKERLPKNLQIQKSSERVDQHSYQHKKAYSKHLLMPDVRFEYEYEERARKISLLEPGWRFGVVARIPLFDGFKNFGDIQKASSALKSTLIEQNLTQQSTEIELKQYYYQWQALDKQISYLKKKWEREQELHEKTRKAFQQKAATLHKLHASEVQVIETETELLNKKREQFLNYVALQKLTGEINHEELIRNALQP